MNTNVEFINVKFSGVDPSEQLYELTFTDDVVVEIDMDNIENDYGVSGEIEFAINMYEDGISKAELKKAVKALEECIKSNVDYLTRDDYQINIKNDMSSTFYSFAYNYTKALADNIENINFEKGSITCGEMVNALKALKECIEQHQPKPMREIAEEHNLELIEVTHGMNGYPSNIKEGIIGFETFEQAEEVAAEYGCEVVAFHRRDGWQLWENLGTRHEPFDNLANDEDVCQFDNAKDAIKFLLEEKDNYMDDYTNDCLNIDEEDYKNELKKYDDEIAFINENWKEGKVIVGSELLYMDVIGRYTMGYYDDTHHYVIGIYRYC